LDDEEEEGMLGWVRANAHAIFAKPWPQIDASSLSYFSLS
jgi:hypothetical protein